MSAGASQAALIADLDAQFFAMLHHEADRLDVGLSTIHMWWAEGPLFPHLAGELDRLRSSPVVSRW